MLEALYIIFLRPALWVGLTYLKYATLTVASHLYWHYFGLVWFISIGVSLFFALVWWFLFTNIAHAFGMSIASSLQGSASTEEYTKVSYKGKVTPGFLSDTVTIKPKYETTSQLNEINKLIGMVWLFDAAAFFFGGFGDYVPFLHLLQLGS